jgi:hypothetical protein
MQRAGWTVETILAHLLALREADVLRVEQRFLAQENAISKADSANTVHFATLNGFRESMAKQQSAYITRSEVYTLVTLAATVAAVIGGFVGHFIR